LQENRVLGQTSRVTSHHYQADVDCLPDSEGG
jgi:hypothetical protein